jgi:hypothetical protein
MTFADARAAALAAFIKRYEPQYPTSRKYNDLHRYNERLWVFEAVKEILADPDIGTEKKPVAPVFDEVVKRRGVDPDAVARCLDYWFHHRPMTIRAKVLVAWREFLVRRRVPVMRGRNGSGYVCLTPEQQKEFEQIELKITGGKQLDLDLRRPT